MKLVDFGIAAELNQERACRNSSVGTPWFVYMYVYIVFFVCLFFFCFVFLVFLYFCCDESL